MIDQNQPEISFAVQAVRQAAFVARKVQQSLITPALTKDDRSPVTVADYAAQAVVGRLLAAAFPDDLVVAEEDSSVLRDPQNAHILDIVAGFVSQAGHPATPEQVCNWIDHARIDSGRRFWTLDPIDGTKGFLRGEQYAVALALVVDGEVRVGVLGCPNLADAVRLEAGGAGSLLIGVRGQGAWITSLSMPGVFERLLVSTVDQVAQARILRSVESGHTNVDQVGLFAQTLGVKVPAATMDSQAKYAVLAAGQGDLYLRLLSHEKPNYREKIWDQAAGSIIIEEAGGRVTDLQGQALDFTTGRSLTNNRGILASNGLLHPAALDALRAIGA
jgi:3'(2'), 5'-bisphosphate nucleotidase